MILACFPFTSETKRMGILVRHKESNRIIYYLKGADIIMIDKVSKIYKNDVHDECEDLARIGLRTLVISQRLISEQEYEKWRI